MKMELVRIEKPDDINFILGQSHFIKTAEDLFECIVNTVPQAKFGLAFCEASMKRKVRVEGNDDDMIELAKKNALSIGAGHSFIIFMKDAYPLNLLRHIKQVPEIANIICATANPTWVVVIEEDQPQTEMAGDGELLGRGILGVVDGYTPTGVETAEDVEWRRNFLRMIGYKK